MTHSVGCLGMTMKKKITLAAAAILAAVMIFAAYRLVDIGVGKAKTEDAFEKLRTSLTDTLPVTEDTSPESEDDISPDTPRILSKYAPLVAENPDFVGWIKIDGTGVNYPVMQSKGDGEFYLSRDFDKNYNAHGVPFLDERCDVADADNYVIYGHHMGDGTMFSDLMYFKDADYCESAPDIIFDTIYGEGVWRVVTVFKISADSADMFPYNNMVDFGDTMTAADYVARCQPYALWTDDSADLEGAKLLTLSTCEYSYTNGRLVVVAAKINN